MTRITGRVKFFDDKRGFGFVTPDKGGQDVFVHRANLTFPGDHEVGALTLVEGQRVNFDQIQTPRGSKAVDVSVDAEQQQALNLPHRAGQ